ncbi:hypothetical protein ATDW_25270 [Asticcacaulis sp. DW145]|uniref:hypothetical protein n=1 Tax=unclassified Asticcacaulis TaxID=2628350 RepID=UPI0030888BB9|nr:hypothetical protein ATDW_25270 [Asticcacaulis sp. DW145]
MSRLRLIGALMAGASFAGGALAEPSPKPDIRVAVPPQDVIGIVEVIGDDLLINSLDGAHRFSGAKACTGLSDAPFVHVRMTEQKVSLGHGGTAQVVYGTSMASVRTCTVTYQGLYSPPPLMEVTPLER